LVTSLLPSQKPIVSPYQAVNVAVLLADVRAPDRRPEIVDLVRDLGEVDELVRVRLEQDARIARRLAAAEAVKVHLAELLLLAPASLVGFQVGGRQDTFADLALKSLTVDEHFEVGVAGRLPQPVPTRHGRERVLRAALGLLEQVGVVLLGARELARRLNDLQRWPEAAAERPALCEDDG
jgi:hypothetical protein